MKNTLLAFCLSACLFASGQVTDQKKDFNDRKHEVKVDGIKLIAGTILEGTYEYVRNKNSGYGVSVLVNLDSENDYLEDFSITPFYRGYFFNKQDYGAKGFFVEGFGKYVSGDVEFFSGDDEVLFGGDRENFNDFSLGMSVGQKWVNSNGLVVELLVGVSRTLGGDSGNEGYFRGGVFVGYRF